MECVLCNRHDKSDILGEESNRRENRRFIRVSKQKETEEEEKRESERGRGESETRAVN